MSRVARAPRVASAPCVTRAPRVARALLVACAAGWTLAGAAAVATPQDAAAVAAPQDATLVLTADEVRLAREFSPLPAPPADRTNAVADDPAAARLGQALFFDPRLSVNGEVSCSTCHDPARGWGDGRALASALAQHDRHSMTLWNVAYNRWFFWDGRKDSLWSQALAPLEDEREHGFSRLGVAHVLAGDPAYGRAYGAVFGPLPELTDGARFPAAGRPVPDDPTHPHAQAWAAMDDADRQAVDRVFANVGKAIAAFERRIVSRRAPFDRFVQGLASGDTSQQAAMGPAAQRGFALFVGKGQCFVCHDGPQFSDGEFHANRVPVIDLIDPGRARGIQRLLADPFNTRSAFADDEGRTGRTRLSLSPRGMHVPGDFKTPSLRNVAQTAPYMHEGQFTSLREVLHFYSTLEDAMQADPSAERLIEARHFTESELDDLLAFLEALTDEDLPQELLGPPPSPELPAAR